jgi:hypothetical protein
MESATRQITPSLGLLWDGCSYWLQSQNESYITTDRFRFFRCCLCTGPAENTAPLLMWVAWYHVFHCSCSGTVRLSPDREVTLLPAHLILTSQQKLIGVCTAVVTWPDNHANMFTKLLPLNGCLLIQLFRLSADMPHYSSYTRANCYRNADLSYREKSELAQIVNTDIMLYVLHNECLLARSEYELYSARVRNISGPPLW